MSKLMPGGSVVSFISFCTASPTSPADRPCTPANTASRRCRFWRRMISGLNTDSMWATLSSAMGVPSLANATGSWRSWSMRSRCASFSRSTTSTWSPVGVVQVVAASPLT